MASAPESASQAHLPNRNQFLIYRLFSLCGLIPIGAYMLVHLVINATVLISPMTYQTQVDNIHALKFWVVILEWAFIFIPILFHGIIGLTILAGAIPNTGSYPYTNNYRYVLQRVTGMIAFAFILTHVLQMHHLGSFIGGGRFDAEHATSSAATVLGPVPMQLLYLVGVLSCVFHLSNGLWTAGITWGLWSTPEAQRRASWISLVFGILLGALSVATIVDFRHVDSPDTKEKIQQKEDWHKQWKEYEDGERSTPPANGKQ